MKTRLMLMVLLGWASLSTAQCTGAFSASANPGTISPGGSATLAYTLANTGPACITAVNLDLNYDPSAFNPPTASCGSAASGAGKVCQGNQIYSGRYRVIIYGGTSVIPNGVVVSAVFPSLGTAGVGSYNFTCEGSASDAGGNPVTVTGCGSVSVTIQDSLSCSASANPSSGPIPLTVDFSASASGGTSPYAYQWDFGDGTTSSVQNPTHTYIVAGSYSWTLNVSDSAAQHCYKSGKINAGILSCSASASPTSGTAPLTVQFSGAGAEGTPPYSYGWQFGDGATSTEQNPSHTYAAAGTYTWTLTVTDTADQTCVETGAITVVPAPVYTSYIPAAAHKEGAYDTHWRTDAVFYNREAAPASAMLYFLEAGKDNTGAAGIPLTVDALNARKIADLVGSFLGKPNAAGAVRIESSRPLSICTRTYNDQGVAGTYGQEIEGYDPVEAHGPNETGILMFLTKNAAYRTNIGFANATPRPLDLQMTVYRETGEPAGTLTYALKPYEFYQDNDVLARVFPDGADNAYALVTSPTADARYFAYASVADNRTGDAVYIAAYR